MSKRNVVLVGVGLFIFLFFFLASFAAFFIYDYVTDRNAKSLNHYETFQYLEVNLLENITSGGFISIPNPFQGEEDFVISRNERSHSSIIISKFGGEDYKCTGSCYCSDSRRIPAPGVISRGLFLVLSAFSTSMATSIAMRVFQDSCSMKFSNTDACNSENVIAEVHRCEKPHPESRTSTPDYDVYDCKGFCQKNKRIKYHRAVNAQEQFGDCRKFSTTGVIRLPAKVDGEDDYKTHSATLKNVRAKEKFSQDFLRPYCREVSSVNYIYDFHLKGTLYSQTRRGDMCVGTNNVKNNNIFCYSRKTGKGNRKDAYKEWVD